MLDEASQVLLLLFYYSKQSPHSVPVMC